MNPNDAVRDAILRHLYDVHRQASSPQTAAKKISDIQKAMKALGIQRSQVGGNLDYLIDTGFVVAVVEQRSYPSRGGTVQSSPVRTYKVSHKGVDRMERASLFQQPPTGQHINVTTINGVTVVGDQNVVNTLYTDLSQALTALRADVLASDTLGEEDKLNAVADIDTIQSQLQKPRPNAGLIRQAWTGVEAIATAAGVVEAAERIAGLISQIM
jgi:hypothetical protein